MIQINASSDRQRILLDIIPTQQRSTEHLNPKDMLCILKIGEVLSYLFLHVN